MKLNTSLPHLTSAPFSLSLKVPHKKGQPINGDKKRAIKQIKRVQAKIFTKN